MTTQFLATLTTIHHLLKREIVVYLVNLRHLLHSIPLDVCFMSQLKRCFNVSFHELIIGCSIYEKIDPSRVFPFPLVVMLVGVLRARRRDKDGDKSTFLRSATWIVKIVLVCVSPSSYPTLESRDEILV